MGGGGGHDNRQKQNDTLTVCLLDQHEYESYVIIIDLVNIEIGKFIKYYAKMLKKKYESLAKSILTIFPSRREHVEHVELNVIN